MPMLKIQTNQPLAAQQRQALVSKASQAVADLLGKPERYVMVSLERNPDMLFGGNDEPLAYLELKSIGLPENQTPQLSGALARLLHDELGLAADRIYIEFVAAPRAMWGWNGSTF
ncbi:MAG: phenylpyruvate tautomerase MIF-related protein [Thiogranum sp.]|nr:phenylpyruvate tautomerase MIF-related protein [Thiogranum sp.]